MFQIITRQWNREGARLKDLPVIRQSLVTHHCWWFQLCFWEMSKKYKEIAFVWEFIVWKLSLLPLPLHWSGCTRVLVSSTGQHWPSKWQHMAPSKKAHCCLVTVRHCFKHSCHQKKKKHDEMICKDVDSSLIIVLMFCNTYLWTKQLPHVRLGHWLCYFILLLGGLWFVMDQTCTEWVTAGWTCPGLHHAELGLHGL